VIDTEAREGITRHIDAMRARGRPVWQPLADLDEAVANGLADAHRPARTAGQKGHFIAPTLIEIERLDELEREVFGPVLHLLRYDRDALPALLAQINATGYGLTCGVHTRIDETVVQVAQTVRAGNLYVNRNVVGAVVGVQPFGGEGLSGTGPKAGGPLYLLRLLAQGPAGAAARALAAAGAPAAAPVRGFEVNPHDVQAGAALQALRAWALGQARPDLVQGCDRAAAQSPVGAWRALPGPTGESNLYALLPREQVLCLAPTGAEGDAARLLQLAAVLAVGSRALWPADAQGLWQRLSPELRERVTLAQDWRDDAVAFDAVLHAGPADHLQAVLATLAGRRGPIVGVTRLAAGDQTLPLERLVIERSLSLNTAAAGGNASLMTIG
jgi:RHH-type transcriptional regulator, proline utilization regulon repressor / proline dehydrogenase / delta 1-pyrroline-5-carboxylate dehydrogenase